MYRVRIQGARHVPAEGPVILAPNHVSYLDPLLVAYGQPRAPCFMTWEAVFRVPVLRWWVRRYGAFPVSLERFNPSAFRQAVAALEAGRCLVIFPEGGRSHNGQLQPLKRGLARLALHTGAPIVPVRLDGLFETWPRNRRWPRLFTRLAISYGPPIRPADVGAARAEASAEQPILDRLAAFIGHPQERP